MTLLSVFLISLPAFAEVPRQLELELGGAASASYRLAPAATLRAAVDLWDCFGVGLRGIGILNYPTAWALLPELRMHLPKERFQPFIAFGAGIGQLVEDRIDTDYTRTHGKPGLSVHASIGVRTTVGPVTLSAEGSVLMFTRVQGGNGFFLTSPTPAQEAREYALGVGLLQLGVGWRGPI